MRQFTKLSFVVSAIAIVSGAKLHRDNIALESINNHGRFETVVAPPNLPPAPSISHGQPRRITGGGGSTFQSVHQGAQSYWWAGERNPFNYAVCKSGDPNCRNENRNQFGAVPPIVKPQVHRGPVINTQHGAVSVQQKPHRGIHPKPQLKKFNRLPGPRPPVKSSQVTALESENRLLKEQVRIQQLQLQQQQIDYQRELEKQIMNLLKQESNRKNKNRPVPQSIHRDKINQLMGPMGVCPSKFICVHWQLCSEGYVIADGSGIIDKTISSIPSQVSFSYESCGGDMICCGIPDSAFTSFDFVESQNTKNFESDSPPHIKHDFISDTVFEQHDQSIPHPGIAPPSLIIEELPNVPGNLDHHLDNGFTSNVPSRESPQNEPGFTSQGIPQVTDFGSPVFDGKFNTELVPNSAEIGSPHSDHDFTSDVLPDVHSIGRPQIIHDLVSGTIPSKVSGVHFIDHGSPTLNSENGDVHVNEHRDVIPLHSLGPKHPSHIKDASFSNDNVERTGPQLSHQVPHVTHSQDGFSSIIPSSDRDRVQPNVKINPLFTDHQADNGPHVESPSPVIFLELIPPHSQEYDSAVLSPNIPSEDAFDDSIIFVESHPQVLLNRDDPNIVNFDNGEERHSSIPSHKQPFIPMNKHVGLVNDRRDPSFSDLPAGTNFENQHLDKNDRPLFNIQNIPQDQHQNIQPVEHISQHSTFSKHPDSIQNPLIKDKQHQNDFNSDTFSNHGHVPSKKPSIQNQVSHHSSLAFNIPSKQMPGISDRTQPAHGQGVALPSFTPEGYKEDFSGLSTIHKPQNEFISDAIPNRVHDNSNIHGHNEQPTLHSTNGFNTPIKQMPGSLIRDQPDNIQHLPRPQTNLNSEISQSHIQDTPLKQMPINPLFTDHQTDVPRGQTHPAEQPDNSLSIPNLRPNPGKFRPHFNNNVQNQPRPHSSLNSEISSSHNQFTPLKNMPSNPLLPDHQIPVSGGQRHSTDYADVSLSTPNLRPGTGKFRPHFNNNVQHQPRPHSSLNSEISSSHNQVTPLKNMPANPLLPDHQIPVSGGQRHSTDHRDVSLNTPNLHPGTGKFRPHFNNNVQNQPRPHSSLNSEISSGHNRVTPSKNIPSNPFFTDHQIPVSGGQRHPAHHTDISLSTTNIDQGKPNLSNKNTEHFSSVIPHRDNPSFSPTFGGHQVKDNDSRYNKDGTIDIRDPGINTQNIGTYENDPYNQENSNSFINTPSRHGSGQSTPQLHQGFNRQETDFQNSNRQQFSQQHPHLYTNKQNLPPHLQGNPFFDKHNPKDFPRPFKQYSGNSEFKQHNSAGFSPGPNFNNKRLTSQHNRPQSSGNLRPINQHPNNSPGNVRLQGNSRFHGSNRNRGNTGSFIQSHQQQRGQGSNTGMMMPPILLVTPLGTPLTEDGGMCSASSYCVLQQECNPFNGFIVMDPYEIPEQWVEGPKVPVVRCIVPGGIQNGVCCQLPHPIMGAHGHLID